jgi:hypothetical protein
VRIMEIFTEEEKAMLHEVIDLHGIQKQAAVAGEECTELARALFRMYEGRFSEENLFEEAADFYIMSEQVMYWYEIHEMVGTLRNLVPLYTKDNTVIAFLNKLGSLYADIAEDVTDVSMMELGIALAKADAAVHAMLIRYDHHRMSDGKFIGFEQAKALKLARLHEKLVEWKWNDKR